MNPLLKGIQNIPNLTQAKALWKSLRGLNNPQEMLNNMLQEGNPALKELNSLLTQAGGDPEKAFRLKAEQMGLNPDEVIKSITQ